MDEVGFIIKTSTITHPNYLTRYKLRSDKRSPKNAVLL